MKKAGFYFCGLPVYERDNERSNRYATCSNDTLSDIYKTWSNDKQKAYNDICHEMERCGGFGVRVWSCAGWSFVCAYLVARPSTGEILLVWHTKDNKRIFCF